MRQVIDVLTGEISLVEEVAPPFPTIEPDVVSITRGQCARELFERAMISGDEMVSMTAVGQPPAFIAEHFDRLPARERSIAYADFARDNYLRSNPLLNSTLSAFGSVAADIDDFFRKAGAR